MFKCKTSVICVLLEDVCDGNGDCPKKDDEVLCELEKSKCPQHCTCLNFALMCKDHKLDYMEHTCTL